MFYLTRIPFKGSIIATVEGKNDPRLPELIERFAQGSKTKVIDDAEFNDLYDAYERSLISGLTEITEEEFNRMLEVLPPCKWRTVKGVEMFHISERDFGSIVSWYFSYNSKFYTCSNFCYEDQSTLADIVLTA